jgi:hypothetical protein
VKVARQEQPGKAEKQKTVPVGTADRSHFQPSLPGLYRSRVFTRQFLPGYFQPRLAALSAKASKDLCPPIVPRNAFYISVQGYLWDGL